MRSRVSTAVATPSARRSALRHRGTGRRDVPRHEPADQLAQQERITSRGCAARSGELVADVVGECLTNQPCAVGETEATQRHAPRCHGHLGQQLRIVRFGAGALGRHHRDPDGPKPPQQVCQPAQRRRVGLVDVVDGHEYRLTRGEVGHEAVQRVQCGLDVQWLLDTFIAR